VRLAFRPWERTAWYWAAVVGPAQPLLAVRAHDVAIPSRGTEIRARGVWSALICETPMEHWSVGLESFGAVFADPWEAAGAERGDVVPFGLDLEWEGSGAVALEAGYGQWCSVHGDVLIGDVAIAVDASGWRAHEWGAPEAPPVAAIGPDPVGDVEVLFLSPVAVPGVEVVHGLCRRATGRGLGWARWWT
jgi:hypothetical protein